MSPYPASATVAIPPSSRYTTRTNSAGQDHADHRGLGAGLDRGLPERRADGALLDDLHRYRQGTTADKQRQVTSLGRVNWPVIWVEPPVIPTSQATCGSTCGEEMISLSSTMATRLAGSPAGAQAALPVSCSQARWPEPRKSMVTNQLPAL